MRFALLKRICLFFQAFIRSGADAKDPKYRLGVGIVLVNKGGKIFVGKRINKKHSQWQMPQGGVDFYSQKPEPFAQAAWRELWEEVGVKNQCQLVARTKNAYRYDFPYFNLWKLRFKGQKQVWYGFIFLGSDKDINLEATDYPEFGSWKWIERQELMSSCAFFKHSLYTKVLEELWPFITDALHSKNFLNPFDGKEPVCSEKS
ncbi:MULTISPECIES: RNA pyrophosphohydrolase [Holospora]|uniref:RNA pyrophosphohydrolase n=2 Tax=Holospora TaxID=44747 RepID=A0A061JGB4_9PROT|nr:MULTISPECIES: RNA pyrophosphohydrolase [Holospora]ETZ05031.1 RNA pyrophosphohydrolase [Holospora undulata HU1]GAJ46294.1 RNA pyrophosphohydrolase [Holospora elegans E1]